MISAIIVNYHSADLTRRAVASLFRDTEDLELIVIDNSVSSVERERLTELSKDYRITLIFNETNEGFARANNRGFSLAHGELVLLLNPDAFVGPGCLGILRDFMEKNPDAGAASPLVSWDDGLEFLFPDYPFPSPFNELCVRLAQTAPRFGTLYSLLKRRRNLMIWRSPLPVRVGNLHGGVVFLQRTAVENSGGLFDERFFLFYEDTDLFLRLKRKGFRLYTVPEAKAVHNYAHRQRKLEIMTETYRLFYEKHYRKSVLARLASLVSDRARGVCADDYGVWDAPPSFAVPPELRGEFLFEWSPSPLFVPAIGSFGAGDTLALPRQVWDLLDAGTYYSRITDPRRTFPKNTVLRWGKRG